jgi:hypothetical protein
VEAQYLAGGITNDFIGSSTSPSARNAAQMWMDYDGLLWLYGGNAVVTGISNELWTYDVILNDGNFTLVNNLT